MKSEIGLSNALDVTAVPNLLQANLRPSHRRPNRFDVNFDDVGLHRLSESHAKL